MHVRVASTKSIADDSKRTLTRDTISIRFCLVRPLADRRSMTQGETYMKKHKLLIAVIMFGLTRSEEHTSELQSHLNLVCRLLLEKKTRSAFHPLLITLRHPTDEIADRGR